MMTLRSHVMPWGAELLPGGGVRFRLWAPSAATIELVIEGGPTLPLETLPHGWWTLDTERAGVGALYRFRVDGGLLVPDPASRFQPRDVHGPSEVIDPGAFAWSDDAWRGRPWEETVLLELHVGTATPEGTFAALIDKLDHYADLGVTAIELMPLSDFEGRRNWGYDGVLPFAPDSSYGRPEDLKRLVAAAHARGLMMFLDVVYNHFGPSGNYLGVYAKPFFTERHHTPWGAAVNFDGVNSGPVRNFVEHNALYWTTEYNFDGLRFDAVDQIIDDSPTHILVAVAAEVRAAAAPDRHVHLVLENYDNVARFLERDESATATRYNAQWNDDIHHAFHVVLTGENHDYYRDYADRPIERLARGLAEGFIYQGETSTHRPGHQRGEPSGHLSPTAFVSFLQNHDQIANRAFGDRLTEIVDPAALRLARAALLLGPSPPLMFMGDEWGTMQRFLFFCDFEGELGKLVSDGRRRQFAALLDASAEEAFAQIADPQDPQTWQASKLDWSELSRPPYRAIVAETARLLATRGAEIAPLVKSGWLESKVDVLDGRGVDATWRFRDGALRLIANFSAAALAGAVVGSGRIIASVGDLDAHRGTLAAWSGAIIRSPA